MAQYIYKIQLVRPELLSEGPTEEEAQILEDHASYISELTKQSKVLLAGRTQITESEAYGIVIISTPTESEAIEIMNNDPAVLHKVMRADFSPYNIAYISASIHEHVTN